MPLLIGVVLSVIVQLTHAAWHVTRRATLELLRRMAGRYRRGYALVPEGTVEGDEVWAITMARDPVFLPPGTDGLVVALVSDARGGRGPLADEGRSWNARSATVEAVLPGWVLLGPSGLAALDVIDAVAASMLEGPERVSDPIALLDVASWLRLLDNDPWRSAVAAHAMAAAEALLAVRLHEQILAELPTAPREPVDDPATMAATQEARQRAVAEELAQRWDRSGWGPAATAAGQAAAAASLAAEMGHRTIEEMSAAWLRLVDPGRHLQLLPIAGSERMVRLASSPVTFIDRHPTTAAAATMSALVVLFALAPPVALIAFAALLIAAASGTLARMLRRTARTGRRRWAPDGDVESAVAPPDAVQLALATFRSGGHPVAAAVLDRLFERATLWLALEPPAPVDPQRRLEWHRRSGDPLPLALAASDRGLVAFVYTAPDRHLIAPEPRRAAWTAPVAFGTAMSLAREAGAAILAVDYDCGPSIELELPLSEEQGTPM